jgi:penicillin amidase
MGARTYRDAYGIPHVRADTVLELAREQGRVTAYDRSWQLEYLRRRATGTAAAALGRRQVGWDTLARRTQMAETGRRAYEQLDGETQAFVSAYVDGVNAGLRSDGYELQRLGLTAQPWEPWTPLAVFHAQHVLFASLPAKLWHHRARAVLGVEETLLCATTATPAAAMRGRSVVSGRRPASR